MAGSAPWRRVGQITLQRLLPMVRVDRGEEIGAFGDGVGVTISFMPARDGRIAASS